jgi:hypothetical protein
MPPKLNPKPDPKQPSVQAFIRQQRPQIVDDPFLSPDPNAGRGDGFPVIPVIQQQQQPSLSPREAISASIEPGDRTLLAREAARAATADLQQRGLPGQRSFLDFMPRYDPHILGSISPDAQREITAAAAVNASDQAAAVAANEADAVAANQAAAARYARAVARGEMEQTRLGDNVLTQIGPIFSPPSSPRAPQGGSGRMNKINFLTFRGRHKSTKSKMKKRAKVTRKSYKRRSQRKRSGKK